MKKPPTGQQELAIPAIVWRTVADEMLRTRGLVLTPTYFSDLAPLISGVLLQLDPPQNRTLGAIKSMVNKILLDYSEYDPETESFVRNPPSLTMKSATSSLDPFREASSVDHLFIRIAWGRRSAERGAYKTWDTDKFIESVSTVTRLSCASVIYEIRRMKLSPPSPPSVSLKRIPGT